ncbi:MAG: TolC family protein [Thermoanaerobaculia bacterium]
MRVGKVFSWIWILPLTLPLVPAALAQSPDAGVLTLRDAIERALSRAPELVTARESAGEAAASALLARDVFHPQAFLVTTPAYASGFPVAVAGQPPAAFSLQLRQTLYNPARRSEALEAQARALDRDGTFQGARAEAALSAVILYTRVWTDQTLLDCARRRLSARQAILERVTALLREGRQTELDLERARLEVARARQRLLDEESESDLDLMEMRRLIGWPGGAPMRLAEDPRAALPEPAFADNLAMARAADPQLRALDRETVILARAASLQKKNWAPVIEAEAQYFRLTRANHYDEFYNNFQENNWSVGFTLALPLWSGGRLADARALAKASASRAESERAARESELEIAVRRAETAVDRAAAQSSFALRAEGVAQEALRVSRLLLEGGRAAPDSVEQAEIALADADEEVARAGLESVAARSRLLALRGQLALVASPAENAAGDPRGAREKSEGGSRPETP